MKLDTRNVLTGKEGFLYDGDGNLLVEVNTFQSQMKVNNTDFQPAGQSLVVAVMTGYTLTLTFTETVVRDAILLQKVLDDINSGKQPELTFQGKIQGRDGSFSRKIYRYCVPDGDIDIHNVKVGELITRAWSFRVNDQIEAQEWLGN